MKRNLAIRIGAVVSSLTLVGVYVGCKTVSTTANSRTDPAAGQPQTERQPEVLGGSKSRAVFSGSKSMMLDPAPATTPAPAPARATVMPGSKVEAPLIPPPAQPKPAPQQTGQPKPK